MTKYSIWHLVQGKGVGSGLENEPPCPAIDNPAEVVGSGWEMLRINVKLQFYHYESIRICFCFHSVRGILVQFFYNPINLIQPNRKMFRSLTSPTPTVQHTSSLALYIPFSTKVSQMPPKSYFWLRKVRACCLYHMVILKLVKC